MIRTTYAPPFRAEALPTTRDGWLRRAGLTDPAIIAERVHRASTPTEEPRYADFFDAR
ncbi:hypothetical protein [Curtobacterium sp. RRHDQ10]|uniref:hypothetical protein n=1 Tax=Curtobacterium phyllosphaerae TaxID=3413379 RepID=UPI003BF13169